MSRGKGKGRAARDDDNEPDSVRGQVSQVSSSLLERVAASASGLARSTFTAPNSAEISDHEAAALAGTGKGQRLGVSDSSTWAEGSAASQGHTQPTVQGQSLPSIRVGHADEHIQQTEAEFLSFLEGIDSFKSSPAVRTDADRTHSPRSNVQPIGVIRKTYTPQDLITRSRYGSVEEQQQRDGEDVLAILTDPIAPTDGLETIPVEDESIDWGLSEEQVLALRPILNELFPYTESHIGPRPDNPLNLIPEIDAEQVTSAPISSMHLIDAQYTTRFGPEATQKAVHHAWMEQWEGVLTRYTDEVWGDLLPLVVEARQEVEIIKANTQGISDEQLKALRRLQAVLGHLRKS